MISTSEYPTVRVKRSQATDSIEKLVIGSYNVLYAQKLKNCFTEFSSTVGYNVTKEMTLVSNTKWRLGLKVKNILNANPNCIALQEVTEEEFREYQLRLAHAHYSGVFCLHPNSFHGVSIFYKSDQFNLLAVRDGVFDCESLDKMRKHLILDMQDKNTGLILRMTSCHLLDPRDWDRYYKSCHLERVLDHADFSTGYIVDVVAICGDMNQDQFGDDITAHLKPNPEPVKLSEISAFIPFLNQYVHDNSIEATEYTKDISTVDGEMISTNRKTDWIFFKIKRHMELQKIVQVPLIPVKMNRDKPMLQKNEVDLRGSDHALILSEISFKRISS